MIRNIVSSDEIPSIDGLMRVDDKNHLMVSFLLEQLTGQDIQCVGISNQITFKSPDGHAVLTLRCDARGKWQAEGERSSDLAKFLCAIRIHEVDSFDWVYLPPEMRRALVEDRAKKVGTNSSEINRLIKIWIANGSK